MTKASAIAVDAELVEALAAALLADGAAPIVRGGREIVYPEALAVCTSLAQDLASSGQTRAQRRFLARWIPQVTSRGASLHDLRKYCRLVRHTLLAHQRERTPTEMSAVQDWLFEFGFSVARAVVAERNQKIRAQEASLELQRAELAITNQEKSRLDELIQDIWIPIAPIYQGVLTVPLLGELDTRRADDLTSRLLREIVRSSANHVLVDLSGVESIDSATARHLADLAAAVEILGTNLALVGIRPLVARMIVKENLAVKSLTTHRNLRDGLVWALEQMGFQIVPLTDHEAM